MKLRIIQQGFENYTGQIGVTFFEDGLSTDHVSVMDATRMGAVMGFEWENGNTTNVAQILLDKANEGAPNVDIPVTLPSSKAEEITTPVPQNDLYTEADLAAIADAKGIAGLRAIADPIGVKGSSIRGIMDAILQAGIAK